MLGSSYVGNISTIIPGETACVECFQGNINDDELPNCALVGVNPSIIGIIASIQVSEAIRLILGMKPNLANILMYCDLSDLSFEKIQLKKSESCPVCGSKPKTNPMPLRSEEIEEICGREERRVFIFSPDECHDVDLNAINLRLRKLGYSLTVEAKLGTSFVRGMTKGSILRSGVLIIEGINGPDEAISLRDDLLIY